MGFFPLIDNSFIGSFIEAHLDGEIRIWVGIVAVAPFMGLKELNKNFFVHPGGGGGPDVFFFVALESCQRGIIRIVVHEVLYDLKRVFFKALNVKVHFGPDLVFRDKVLFGGVGVGVVFRAAVPAGDDHFFAGFFLHKVQQVNEDWVDALFAVDDGEAVAQRPLAVADWVFGVVGVGDRFMGGVALAAEKVAGDEGETFFPGVGTARSVGRGMDREV